MHASWERLSTPVTEIVFHFSQAPGLLVSPCPRVRNTARAVSLSASFAIVVFESTAELLCVVFETTFPLLDTQGSSEFIPAYDRLDISIIIIIECFPGIEAILEKLIELLVEGVVDRVL